MFQSPCLPFVRVIEHAASQSSVTRRKHQVRLADGSTADADVCFEKMLREFGAPTP